MSQHWCSMVGANQLKAAEGCFTCSARVLPYPGPRKPYSDPRMKFPAVPQKESQASDSPLDVPLVRSSPHAWLNPHFSGPSPGLLPRGGPGSCRADQLRHINLKLRPSFLCQSRKGSVGDKLTYTLGCCKAKIEIPVRIVPTIFNNASCTLRGAAEAHGVD